MRSFLARLRRRLCPVAAAGRWLRPGRNRFARAASLSADYSCPGDRRRKTPSTKSQAPKKSQVPIAKGWGCFGIWELELLWDLGFGIWCFSHRYLRDHQRIQALEEFAGLFRMKNPISRFDAEKKPVLRSAFEFRNVEDR